jgi:polyhydroxybutyrate depolymerase
MRPGGGFLTCVLASLLAAACQAAGDSPVGPGTHDLRVGVADAERSYYLHVPPGAGSGEPLPLLIAFHGGGGSASGYREYAGLDTVADREGLLVAYPDGTGPLGRRLLTWNAGGCCGRAMRDQIDDVAFVRSLIENVSTLVAVDRTRVYATGHSNGAMMSYRVAAEAPDLLAAIAPVGGAMILEPFEGIRPMPVLHVHSVDDPRALYEGGLGPPVPLTRSRVDHNAVEAELQRWIALNGCPAEPALVEEKTEAATGHTARRLRWAPCESGAEIELWKLTGAGHGWPGSDVGPRQRLVGPNTKVIIAADEVWRFVSRFRKQPVE